MSDTSGLPNTNGEGVPAEDTPERFEEGRDAQSAEPAETEQGQSDDQSRSGGVSAPQDTGIAPAPRPPGAPPGGAGGPPPGPRRQHPARASAGRLRPGRPALESRPGRA